MSVALTHRVAKGLGEGGVKGLESRETDEAAAPTSLLLSRADVLLCVRVWVDEM